jgi:CRP-like cAMP-binding protein
MQTVPECTARSPSANRLLDALRRESPRLVALGEEIAWDTGTELVRAGAPIQHVYFPVDGVLSIMVGTATGELADALTVGNEGMVSQGAWLGLATSLETVLQQATGTVIRMPARDFCRALPPNGSVRKLLNHYTAYSLRLGYQNAVCNARHSVSQRACRWLLSAVDRAHSPRVRMTQTMLAATIGARRQTVGELMVEMHRDGHVRTGRQAIEVLDRGTLERRACGCYRITWDLYRELVEPLL